MLDETLEVWTGEMGRTPRVGQSVVGGAGAGRDGRDHWGSVCTTLLAGGGIGVGVVHGSSDRYAAYPKTQPTSPADLAATVYHCLGVDPRIELTDRLGRPMVLCEGDADPRGPELERFESGWPGLFWYDISRRLRGKVNSTIIRSSSCAFGYFGGADEWH